MKFGVHISISHGLEKVPSIARKIGCECFQFFSRSPRGGKEPPLTPKIIQKFKRECKKYNFKEYYIHAPYFINLASSNNKIYYGSISALRKELERGSLLGAKYLMSHLGSARDLGEKRGLKKVIEGLKMTMEGYKGKTQFLIEMSAGAGEIIGDKFEEIKFILHRLSTLGHLPIGVCFDTAHALESGYDLKTSKAVKKTFGQFEKIIGLKYLKLIHANDSKTDLGSHLDRHEHIGRGKIGLEGFKAIIHEPRLRHLNMILETPGEWVKDDIININLLKRLRNESFN